MKYARTAGMFFNTPLAILPAKADEILGFWQAKLQTGHIDFEAHQEPFAPRYFAMTEAEGLFEVEPAAASGSSSQVQNGVVAVLPLHGIMSQRIGMLEAMSGGVSTDAFKAALREQVNNPQVKAVIIDVASPGGSVYGIDELATEIHSMREQKPIVAVANSGMFSASYYPMSNASEIVITPGGELGSIGVIAMHIDQSALNEKAGVKPTLITFGKYKAEGNSHEPLNDEAHAEIQRQVDRYGHMFIAAVARGREVSTETVRTRYGQGRIFGAQEAVRLGMADRIATLEQTIQRFASGGRVNRRGAKAEAEGFHLIIKASGEPETEEEALASAAAREAFVQEHASDQRFASGGRVNRRGAAAEAEGNFVEAQAEETTDRLISGDDPDGSQPIGILNATGAARDRDRLLVDRDRLAIGRA